MKSFFRRVKKKEKPGFPKFKNRYQDQSMRFPDPHPEHRITATHVDLPKIGWVRYTNSRPYEGAIKQITVKREGKHWFVVLSCVIQRTVIQAPQLNACTLGLRIDTDSSVAYITDDKGLELTTRYYQDFMPRLAGIQKSMARKVKGSNNRQKCIERLNKMHIKVKNRRKDWLHKFSTLYVQNHDVITIPDLPIKEWMANEQFALALGDLGWHAFVMMLKYKCEWHGKHFVEVK
jgi:putative transposase